MKKYVFDIDGTICSEGPAQERIFASPVDKIIKLVNNLYKQGHFIILYTARSWDQYRVTEHWLKTHKVKYHTLICGKPIYDYWIDDRCINVKDVKKGNYEF